MRLRISAILVVVLLFASSAVFADTDELVELGNRLQKCEERWCLSVAQPPTPWPHPLITRTISIEEHPTIVIDIPSGFSRMRRTDYFLMFIYDNKKVLTIEEITKEAFPELRENTKNSKMTMADAAHATFTKTTKVKVPECPDDKKFWYWSMFFKMAFFENDHLVFSSKKGSLTMYYLSSKLNGGVLKNTAVIVNDSSPHYILKLGSANMSFDEFKSVIGTIKEKKVMNP